MIVPCPIHQRARRTPAADALVQGAEALSYEQLHRVVTAATDRLADRGVGRGGRVALRPQRGWRTVALLWAIWRCGAVAAPISRRLPAESALDQVRHVRAGLVVAPDDDPVSSGAGEAGFSVATLSDLTSRPEEAESRTHIPADPPEMDLDAPATIVFTSGSTGTPKAAVHSLGNHYYSAIGSNENISVSGGDRWMTSLPLYHVGGLAILFRCAWGGGAVALPDGRSPVHEAIEDTGATHVSLVATQLRRLLDAFPGNGGEGIGRVRAMLLGGSAIPAPLLDEAVARGWPVHTTYGCTEMASQITTTPPGASREVLRTSGRCLPHCRLAIRDGHIRVGGKTLCLGYLRPDGSVRGVRGDDGRYATGDLGWIDDDGYLHVTGRADRLIISGGENIQPEEVEAALVRLPGIARAFVVRVPDDDYGERPVAFVEADDVDGSAIREALREHLPGFKIPDAVYPLPGEAVAGRMKVDRDLLRRTARKLRSLNARRTS